MFTHINVSRRPHCAINNLTGDASRRASPDACHTPARTVWVASGVPYLIALCCGSKPRGDCRVPVLLTLQCVSDRTSVSHGEPGYPCCSRRSAPDRGPNECLDAVAPPPPRNLTSSRSAGVWLVPHAVELGHPRGDAPGQTRERGVRSNRPPLAPCDRLGVETGEAGSQR